MAAYTSPFSFLFYDFLTAKFLGQLPLAGVQWSQTLNTAGTLQGTLNLADPRVQAMDPAFLTAPGRTLCAIDYGGQIVWAGWSMTTRPFTRSTRIMNYTATELWSYLGRRIQAADYSSPPYSSITGLSSTMPIWAAVSTSVTVSSSTVQTGWDPMLIGAQVINDVLGYSNSDAILNGNPVGGMKIGLNGYGTFSPTATTPTAVTDYVAAAGAPSVTPSADYININYPYTSFQKCDSILSQLMGLGYGVGFDGGIDVAYSAGRGSPIMATVNLSYPRRGRTFANNNVVVNAGGASRDYTVTPDASNMANTLYEIGGQNAVVISQNINPLEQGYAIFEDSVSRSQIQSANIIGILTGLGFGDLFVTSFPPVTFSVTVPLFGNDPTFGQFIVGDNCRLLVDPDEMFPNGLDSEWRITSYTVNLPDQGDATIQLTLSPPPVYPTGAYV